MHEELFPHKDPTETTWLEELIGLAEGGGEGLNIAKEVYAKALAKIDALSEPTEAERPLAGEAARRRFRVVDRGRGRRRAD